LWIRERLFQAKNSDKVCIETILTYTICIL
jgi:hypothetical protein